MVAKQSYGLLWMACKTKNVNNKRSIIFLNDRTRDKTRKNVQFFSLVQPTIALLQ